MAVVAAKVGGNQGGSGSSGGGTANTYNDRISIKQALGSPTLAETWPLERLAGTRTLADGSVEFQSIWLPVAGTVTGVKWWQATQGSYTADNYNGVGLYTYSGGTLTLVASSTDDGNIWKVASTGFGSKAFTTPYVASAGLYFIGAIYNSSAQVTAPQIVCGSSSYVAAGGAFDYTNSAKAMGIVAGPLAALPTPQLMSGVSTSGIIIWLGLY